MVGGNRLNPELMVAIELWKQVFEGFLLHLMSHKNHCLDIRTVYGHRRRSKALEGKGDDDKERRGDGKETKKNVGETKEKVFEGLEPPTFSIFFYSKTYITVCHEHFERRFERKNLRRSGSKISNGAKICHCYTQRLNIGMNEKVRKM